MKIGIIGTRGIPNHYGGFEQFAEQLAVDLVQRGHDVSVYNSHKHPYQEKEFKGVKILHCYDPEHRIGTAGQFVYDLNCILHSRRQNFDILLQLGYTSSSVWRFLLPRKAKIITNMDGLEWKRSKYSEKVKRFLKMAERWAVNSSDVLVADSIGIQSYLKKEYAVESAYIPYGALQVADSNPEFLKEYNVESGKYSLLIARMEPENNIETIVRGYVDSGIQNPLLIVGNYKNAFGSRLYEKYSKNSAIRWMGAIYNMQHLNSLRHHCLMYFHGHTVGGTNPSLLEAMACKTFIVAHRNEFNEAILGNDALYFSDSVDISKIVSETKAKNATFIENNFEKIGRLYAPDSITNRYESLFKSCLTKS